MYLTLKNFRHLVEDHPFTIFTDHKPLVTAFTKKSAPVSDRQYRHFDFISQFPVTISYLKGEHNLVASAISCATALFFHWFARFGIPEHLTSDRGSSFVNELWNSFSTLFGIQVHCTTSYHPCSNGLLERSHRALKASLMSRSNSPNWFYELPWVLLGLRSTVKEDLGISVAELVLGQTLTLPCEFFPADLDANVEVQLDATRRIVAQHLPLWPAHHRSRPNWSPDDLWKTEYVFVRVDSHKPPLGRPYRGPYKVLQRSQSAFQLQLETKIHWVSIEHLKVANLPLEGSGSECVTRSGCLPRPPERFSAAQ